MKKILAILIFIFIIPFFALAQEESAKKKAYYFYGEQCPHCHEVDEYFQENGIYEKYEIEKLEVSGNPFNGKLFLEFGEAFGAENWGGVPAIVFGSQYLIGDTPIIDNFVREIEASQNANELPSSEKISQDSGNSNQESPDDAIAKDRNNPDNTKGETGKIAKNWPAIALIGIVVVGGGVLLFNRSRGKEGNSPDSEDNKLS